MTWNPWGIPFYIYILAKFPVKAFQIGTCYELLPTPSDPLISRTPFFFLIVILSLLSDPNYTNIS